MEENLNDQPAVSSVPPSAEPEKQARVRDLFVWQSLNRPAWQYGKEVYTTLGAVVLLVSIILAFFQEWLGIVVAWAAYFLFWALSKIEPIEVSHKITTEGIVSMDRGYLWSELGPFWFSEKGNDITLHVLHRNVFGQLIVLIDKNDQEKIKEALAEYLPYIEVPEKSSLEKFTEWFGKKFPLEGKGKTS